MIHAFLVKLKKEYREAFGSKRYIFSLILGLVVLFSSFVINFYAGNYATVSQSNYVTDIILSNVRVYDLDGIFTYGFICFILIIVALGFAKPQRGPYLLKACALFVLIRSSFIILTHIAPFPTRVTVDPTSIIGYFTFGGDLFFSGHTGLPFLMALVFWKQKVLRYFFLVTSVVFAIVVLLTHLHYSIDVLAAFFITYSIFHLTEFFFKEDREVFLGKAKI